MTAHPYQSIGHDASISATPGTGEMEGTLTVEIVVGEHAETRIVVWAEDLARMVVGALGEADLRLLAIELQRRSARAVQVEARLLCSPGPVIHTHPEEGTP